MRLIGFGTFPGICALDLLAERPPRGRTGRRWRRIVGADPDRNEGGVASAGIGRAKSRRALLTGAACHARCALGFTNPRPRRRPRPGRLARPADPLHRAAAAGRRHRCDGAPRHAAPQRGAGRAGGGRQQAGRRRHDRQRGFGPGRAGRLYDRHRHREQPRRRAGLPQGPAVRSGKVLHRHHPAGHHALHPDRRPGRGGARPRRASSPPPRRGPARSPAPRSAPRPWATC